MTTSSARRGRHWPQYNVTKSRHSCKLGKETRSPDNVRLPARRAPHLLLPDEKMTQTRISNHEAEVQDVAKENGRYVMKKKTRRKPDKLTMPSLIFLCQSGEDEHT
ncbi:uncharacterized protein LOC135089708 isoform X3 [Scylla paramamosain]|uniref:uncharacterized protein LOC135089708 isoform X3 n=1 Tax=Scylla paramamosain TaxID=85552 RepID=UPI003082DF24